MENNLTLVKENFKELPNNIEAEQSVIGSILVTNEIFDEINTIISNVNLTRWIRFRPAWRNSRRPKNRAPPLDLSKNPYS